LIAWFLGKLALIKKGRKKEAKAKGEKRDRLERVILRETKRTSI
jgi:hypothetical protein